LNKYKMGHLEGNFTPVLYIGRKVPKRLNNGNLVYTNLNLGIWYETKSKLFPTEVNKICARGR
jgi:hypothetical protein